MSIDHAEEDWRLVIGTPDASLDAPQTSTSMTPDSSSPDLYGYLTINYRDEPSFQEGGLQVEAWNGDTLLTYASQKTEVLNTSNEVISWTGKMSLSGSTVSYQITSGRSTTWGNFGGGSNLSISFSASISDLSGYDPDTSLSGSSVFFAPNRVTSFGLVQVRYYEGLALSLTDTNLRAKHQPPWY